jgi:hypothetical protein
MDTKRSVSDLREHSEQLRKLSTTLSADLSKLRLALSQQERSVNTEERGTNFMRVSPSCRHEVRSTAKFCSDPALSAASCHCRAKGRSGRGQLLRRL